MSGLLEGSQHHASADGRAQPYKRLTRTRIIQDAYDLSERSILSAFASQSDLIEVLALSQDEWRHILELINSGTHAQRAIDNQRKCEGQIGFGLIPFILLVGERGSSGKMKMAFTHLVGSEGVGMIHKGPVEPGVSCVCWPRDLERTDLHLEGVIRWCRPIFRDVCLSSMEPCGVVDPALYWSCSQA